MSESATTYSKQELLELEIGAFMGPHIKRARIALVLIAAVFVWTTYTNYDDIARFREMMNGFADGSGPMFAKAKRLADVAYVLVIFTGIAGFANLVLAAIGGRRPTFAMYAAMGIFAVYTALNMYLSEALILTTLRWWLMAIVLGMGVQAAYKAHELRKSAAKSPA